jgi:iron complex outermembrane receptor protein
VFAADEARLEEIIVTASARYEPDADPVIDLGISHRTSLIARCAHARDLSVPPERAVGTGPDSGTAHHRGITSTDFTEVGEGAVAIHFDGFYSPPAGRSG